MIRNIVIALALILGISGPQPLFAQPHSSKSAALQRAKPRAKPTPNRNCTVSAWSGWTLQSTGACTYDSASYGWFRTNIEQRSRTVVTPASGTGTCNDVLVETRNAAPVACTPPTPVGIAVNVSGLTRTVAANGWGPVETDRSNGEDAAGDGATLTLNGQTYSTGLGAHAYSDVTVTLPASCERFIAFIGVDDEMSSTTGSVQFKVSQNGSVLYQSGVMTPTTPTATVNVPLNTSATTLRLEVLDAGDGVASDHGDWADAKVYCPTDGGSGGGGGGGDWTPPATDVTIASGSSIQAAVDANPNGTKFLISNGIYRMQSITPKPGQHFYGQSEGGVILNGSRVLTMVQDGARWKATGQAQEQAPLDTQCNPDSPRCANPEDLFLDNVRLRHVATLAEVGPGTWYFDYPNDTIYMGDNPTGKTVETTITPRAFSGSATDVVLSHVTVEKYGTRDSGAISLGFNARISNVTTRRNHYSGMWLSDGSEARFVKSLNNGAYGFNGAGPDMLLEDAEIAYNNEAGFNEYWDAGGTKFVYTGDGPDADNYGMVVRRAYSHHNRGNGIWFDINNDKVLVEDSTIEDNALSGIFQEIGYSAIIRRNMVRRNGNLTRNQWWVDGAGILVVGARDVEIYENQVLDNYQGIAAHDDCRGTGTMGVWEVRNLWVHNNTVRSVAQPGPGAPGAGTGRSGLISSSAAACGTATFTSKNNRFDYNTYQLGGTADRFLWNNGDRSDSYWQTTAGQDVHGTITRQ